MNLGAAAHLQGMRATLGTIVATLGQLGTPAGVEDHVRPDGVVPPELVRFLARLRLLEGVPFSYLVPDAALLPPETVRFFYLDRNATDALVEGALSVGTVNSADRVQLAELYPTVRDEVDAAERLVRMKDSDAPAVDATGRPIGAGGPISGFLLRSRLVSGWPALHVRAYATDNLPGEPDDRPIPDLDTSADRIRLLRMERLAPAVLLVLFDGVPQVVHLEEPRAGIQFGVRLADGAQPGQQRAVLTVRNVKHPEAGNLTTGGGRDRTVPVPFRRGAPGVVDLKTLNASLVAIAATEMGASVDSAEFALQMLRYPLRQVFGDTTAVGESFVATLSMAALTEKFALAATVVNR